MTQLQYSRDEMPISCPACGSTDLDEKTVSRDTYAELLGCCCNDCNHSFKVQVTED
jgi:hypothetical protein